MVEEYLGDKVLRVFTGVEEEEVTFESALSFLANNDSRVRDSARAAVEEALRDARWLATHELNAVMATTLAVSKTGGYELPEHVRFEMDDVDPAAAEAMLTAVERNFASSQRFYELKRRLLGRERMSYWEKQTPFGNLPDGYSWDEAVEIVLRSFGQLDPEFAAAALEAIETGHVDSRPRPGKIGGAFCESYIQRLGSWVLLSFSGSAGDIETLAHELGHHLNNLWMAVCCNGLDYDLSTPLAEVASTFQERFINDLLMDGVDDETRLAFLISTLGSWTATIHRQSAAMRFEQALYRGMATEGRLSAERISELFREHMTTYMGDQAEGCEDGWVHWSHFRNNFYVYAYSMAQLLAMIFQARVKADPGYIKEFKHFLEAGMSQSPAELLLSLGIDITDPATWKEGLDQYDDLLREAEELARRLGKI
jgi:oligoendopeptidase F